MTDPHQILIVEDSPTQALRLRMDLEAQNWNVTTVGTADEALRRLRPVATRCDDRRLLPSRHARRRVMQARTDEYQYACHTPSSC